MNKKVVLITGGTGGIGKQTAIALAERGFSVLVTGRIEQSARNCVTEIKSLTQNNEVDYLIGDFSSFNGVTSLVNQFKSKHSKLDVLINNAGSAATSYSKTEDGFETNFAVNVLAPFLLARMLNKELMNADNPRLITLTGGDLPSKIDLHNIQSEQKFDGLNTYSQTKMVMMSLMYEYAQQIKETKLTVNVAYPGQASTNMTQNVTAGMLPLQMRPFFPLFKLLVKPDGGTSAKKASRSSVYLATSDEVNGKTAIYVNKNMKQVAYPKTAVDQANRKFIWEYVNRLLT